MVAQSRSDWRRLVFLSIVSFALAVGCLTQISPKAGIADRESLLEASGTLAWVQDFRYGTRFGLVGIDEKFNFPSKARGVQQVRDALRNAGNMIVSVHYEGEADGPVYSTYEYHNVWEIMVGGRTIRSYEESAKHWESDNRFGQWLGVAFLVASLVSCFEAWKLRGAAK